MEDKQIIKNVTDVESEASTPQETQAKQGVVNSPVKKQKDPKKVLAGKALARKNAEAKKAKKEKDDTSDTSAASPTSLSFSDINNEIQTAAGFVAAGFVLYHGWKFFTSSTSSTPSTPSTPSTSSTNNIHVEPKPNMMGNMDLGRSNP